MLRHLLKVFFIVQLVFVFGCSESTSPRNAIHYFDLKNYFENQIIELAEKDPLITKRVTMNEETQEQQTHISDWNKELSSFSQADINKPALIGKYMVDTVSSDQKETIIRYSASKKNLKTRRVEIRWDTDKEVPSYIEIEVANHNMLYNFTQLLTYQGGIGYHISGDQEIKLLGGNKFSVEGEF